MSKVFVTKGEDRSKNILQALKGLEELPAKLEDKENIVVKVDLTSAQKQELSTHKDSLESLLKYVSRYCAGKFLVVGSARVGNASEAFENFNYYDLKEDYDVEFVDLNKENIMEEIEIYARDLAPIKTIVPKIVLDSDFLISLAGLKIDDSVIASMGIKNMAECMVERPINHKGYKAIHLSLVELMKKISPDLSIIDGFEAFQGEGPLRGEAVDMHLAIAGFDFVSVDTVGAYLMGLNPYKIGYLSRSTEEKLGAGDISEIDITSEVDIDKLKKEFRKHSRYEEQLKWE